MPKGIKTVRGVYITLFQGASMHIASRVARADRYVVIDTGDVDSTDAVIIAVTTKGFV